MKRKLLLIIVICIFLSIYASFSIAVVDNVPVGWFDSVTNEGLIIGWAYDADMGVDSIIVDYYLDETEYCNYLTGTYMGRDVADKFRPDVDDKYPGYGNNHGFEHQLTDLSSGWHTISVYAINYPLEGLINPCLGHKVFCVPKEEVCDGIDNDCDGVIDNNVCNEENIVNKLPVGWFDSVTNNGLITGWAYDANQGVDSIDVHYYLDETEPCNFLTGIFVGSEAANKLRPDVNDVFPGYGNNHGFNYQLSGLEPGLHGISVYAINSPTQGGFNPCLGYKTFCYLEDETCEDIYINEYPEINQFEVFQSDDEIKVVVTVTDDNGIDYIKVSYLTDQIYDCNGGKICNFEFSIDILTGFLETYDVDSFGSAITGNVVKPFCGDGICGSIEKERGICPIDCNQKQIEPELFEPNSAQLNPRYRQSDSMSLKEKYLQLKSNIFQSKPESIQSRSKPSLNKITIQNRNCLEECSNKKLMECFNECGINPPKITMKNNYKVLEFNGIEVRSKRNIEIKNDEIIYTSKNGETEIKILPHQAFEIALDTINIENVTIELIDGVIRDTENPSYVIDGFEKSKVLGLIPIEKTVSVEVDSKSGEVIEINKPWYDFLTTDSENKIQDNEIIISISAVDIDGLIISQEKSCPEDCNDFEEPEEDNSNLVENFYLKKINYDGVETDILIDKPNIKDVDVLLIYHGTASYDSEIINSSKRVLEATKEIIKKDNLIYISVVYPEEGLLFGDNIKEAEAALLWVKNKASQELNVNIDKVYLLGHSQGGLLVTRLNTMHKTDGVIANGAGPINLSVPCQLYERGVIDIEKINQICLILKEKYGSVFDNSIPYTEDSLINFVSGHKSKILFIQGMDDSDMQIKLWFVFKNELSKCSECDYEILEVLGGSHEAVFNNKEASDLANEFLFN